MQIEAFLQRHPDFTADPVNESVPETFLQNQEGKGSILTLPGKHAGFDGGFCQRLRKKRESGNEHAA